MQRKRKYTLFNVLDEMHLWCDNRFSRLFGAGVMKKVLLVYDDAAFLESLKDALEHYADGIGRLLAAHGDEALDILRKKGIDTPVTDLKMPGLDGFGIIAQVLEKSPDDP